MVLWTAPSLIPSLGKKYAKRDRSLAMARTTEIESEITEQSIDGMQTWGSKA